ncbi:MAG: glycosyl hydrolase-related protein [Marinilabiliales bacterium]|nr:glycosyl hydrolase-related protein [Marinilabiliales bacterium]
MLYPNIQGKTSSLSLLNINNDQVNIQAVKMAEDGSGVVVRLQELYGQQCNGVNLSAALPVKAAELIDGAERPLGIQLATKKNVLSLDFTPYELKTVLLTISGAGQMPAVTQPLELDYDTDIFSYNNNREDGYIKTELPRSRRSSWQLWMERVELIRLK